MTWHANLKLVSDNLPCEMLHIWSNIPTRSTSSLARLLARCACFIMVTCSCHHMPVGSCNIVTEHRVRTQRFRSTLRSGLDLVSFPSGRTSALGLELGTRLWFVGWITGEIALVPLSEGKKKQARRLLLKESVLYGDFAIHGFNGHLFRKNLGRCCNVEYVVGCSLRARRGKKLMCHPRVNVKLGLIKFVWQLCDSFFYSPFRCALPPYLTKSFGTGTCCKHPS